MADSSKEIQAMATLDSVLAELSEDEIRRVLQWSMDKFGGALGKVAPRDGASMVLAETSEETTSVQEQRSFEHIADLWDAATPNSADDYVLVVSYWFQAVQGEDNVTGQQINTQLKNLGHGASNITVVFSRLIKSTPSLVRQIEKSGRSKQARKKYRLTTAGTRRVEDMIASTGE